MSKEITRKEAIEELKLIRANFNYRINGTSNFDKALKYAIASLETDEAYQLMEEEPKLCEDCISREYIYKRLYGLDHDEDYECDEFGGSRITYHTCDWDEVLREIEDAPSVTPQEPKCKDCKWWKDSDGEYRRGCGAESICRINTDKVYQGEGYCYLFEPQESEDNK